MKCALRRRTIEQIRCGIFGSTAELNDAIHDYLERHNADPKPFIWTKTAEVILGKDVALSTLSKPPKREPSAWIRNTSMPGINGENELPGKLYNVASAPLHIRHCGYRNLRQRSRSAEWDCL
jgi:hypothetical protein